MSNQINVLHPGNPVNSDSPKSPRRRSTFGLSRPFLNTTRFGSIQPFFVHDTVPGDRTRVSFDSKVNSLSFKAPLYDHLSLKHDVFNVPLSAIVPRAWERFISQPNIGDDVPQGAGPVVATAFNSIGTQLEAIAKAYRDAHIAGSDNSLEYASLFMYLFYGEMFFSKGSLANELGYGFGGHAMYRKYISDSVYSWQPLDFDSIFDQVWDVIKTQVETISCNTYIDGVSQSLAYYNTNDDGTLHNFRDFCEHFREGDCRMNSSFTLSFKSSYDRDTLFAAIAPIIFYQKSDHSYVSVVTSPSWSGSNPPEVNISRFAAYQLCCAHFYSNDSIDFVYTANLWRENFLSVVSNAVNPGSYTWNGISERYEALSGKCVSGLLEGFLTTQWNMNLYWPGLTLLFSHRSPLRYVDFYTGLKTRPLAIGNTDIPVVSNLVDVVDVTRSIMLQRFLNAVNRTGRKISNYVSELFGVVPKHDICDPDFLFHFQTDVTPDYVDNNGPQQLSLANSQTSRLNGLGRYEFSFENDSFGVVIGLHYYDIARKYTEACEPGTLLADRFDYFNPFIENTGDQPVYRCQLDDFQLNPQAVFGYQQRYMQYKQAIARACGGFVHNLPGFAFVQNNQYSLGTNIGDSFIRSHNRELDGFFVSLTGMSLGSYFHFINMFNENVVSERGMSSSAQIL